MVLQASKCCLELLSQLGRFPVDIPDCEITELKIHLGIGAGSVYDVHVVGDVSRSEHFIAGNGVNQLAQVLDLAKPGIHTSVHTECSFANALLLIMCLPRKIRTTGTISCRLSAPKTRRGLIHVGHQQL